MLSFVPKHPFDRQQCPRTLRNLELHRKLSLFSGVKIANGDRDALPIMLLFASDYVKHACAIGQCQLDRCVLRSDAREASEFFPENRRQAVRALDEIVIASATLGKSHHEIFVVIEPDPHCCHGYRL